MLKLGKLVYISMKNLSLPKGQASKLLPKYIGPYKILEVVRVCLCSGWKYVPNSSWFQSWGYIDPAYMQYIQG